MLNLVYNPEVGPATIARLEAAGRRAALPLERIELLGQSRRVARQFIEAEHRGNIDAFLIRVDWEALEWISRSHHVPVMPDLPVSLNDETGRVEITDEENWSNIYGQPTKTPVVAPEVDEMFEHRKARVDAVHQDFEWERPRETTFEVTGGRQVTSGPLETVRPVMVRPVAEHETTL